MPSCMVKTCKNGYKGHNTPKGIRWFHLPKSQSLKDRWLSQINRKGQKNFNNKYAQICSEHFRPGSSSIKSWSIKPHSLLHLGLKFEWQKTRIMIAKEERGKEEI